MEDLDHLSLARTDSFSSNIQANDGWGTDLTFCPRCLVRCLWLCFSPTIFRTETKSSEKCSIWIEFTTNSSFPKWMNILITLFVISLLIMSIPLTISFVTWISGRPVCPFLPKRSIDNLYATLVTLPEPFLQDDWLALIVPAFEYRLSIPCNSFQNCVNKYSNCTACDL